MLLKYLRITGIRIKPSYVTRQFGSRLLMDGKLGWVQPVGADPKKVTRDMTELYGTGAFLMAASEIYKLADK